MSKFAALFDLDGTLVNSLKDICNALNQVRAEHGLKALANETILPFIGKGAENLVQGCFPAGFTLAQLVQGYESFYAAHPHLGGEVYAGVPETLQSLRERGFVLAVVTNKPSLVAEKTLEHYLPSIKFAAVMGPERVSRKKPDAYHLLDTLNRLELSPEQAFFVGDDPVDALCAQAAKVRFFGATYGFGKVQVPPDQQLKQFSDLLNKI